MSYGQLQRWRPSTRSSVVGERSEPRRRVFRLEDIERGWRVEDSQATRIGTVRNAGCGILTISRGFLMGTLDVPLTAIAVVREGVVRLNVTRAWVEAQGWDPRGTRRLRRR